MRLLSTSPFDHATIADFKGDLVAHGGAVESVTDFSLDMSASRNKRHSAFSESHPQAVRRLPLPDRPGTSPSVLTKELAAKGLN